MNAPVLEVDDLHVRFGSAREQVHAVRGVGFTLGAGTVMGVVGESGSGKSTTAKAIAGLVPIMQGSVRFHGGPVRHRPGAGGVQMIFQDPVASLNPHRQVRDVVAEPLLITGTSLRRARSQAADALADVGLDPDIFGGRRARQLSGGQAQRVAIARALLARPALLIADEPVSGLDVSVQAGIINLLHRSVTEQGTALLFVSHDLSVVRSLCESVLVLHRGETCEQGPCSHILGNPQHPYTRSLIASVPEPGRSLAQVPVASVSAPDSSSVG
ncbi:ABC transporter ATP-binding protein [Microbacterium esteraromaticum]|uniref:ABC transporter ATP-binding protein n=1 Tax=Microbacterium esteraromaticum TaxID=57043 RepID=UPI001A8DEDCB|nr:ATP-binding cassette domain-containing protein [Microbacterium esteraromaticum]MBN8423480.1 ABC transporter ATP-binding protein [Microbacterium esteraromaticum]